LFAMESVAINRVLTLHYFKKILEYRKKWWSGKVTASHENIIDCIIGNLFKKDTNLTVIGKLYNNEKLSMDIRDILMDWISWQDPKNGDNYMWLYSSFSFVDFIVKKTRADDLLNTIYSAYPELSGRLGHLRSRIGAIKSNDLLYIAWALNQECLGKLSFLTLPDRINKPPKEELFDISDSEFLRDLIKVSRVLEKEKKKALPFEQREVSIGISIFR
jgi:hypothetical protein